MDTIVARANRLSKCKVIMLEVRFHGGNGTKTKKDSCQVKECLEVHRFGVGSQKHELKLSYIGHLSLTATDHALYRAITVHF